MKMVAALLIAVLLAAAPLSAQIGIGVRASTMGVGPEVAIDLAGPLVLRGGVAYRVLEPTVRMTDIDWTLELPSPSYNLGLDLYLNRAMRVGGGVLFKSEDPRIVAALGGPVTVGGQTYTAAELGSLIGTADSGSRRPYAVLGFGRHTVGSGLYLDVGAVWLGEPEFLLESSGGTYPDQATLDASLRQGEVDLESSVGTYLKIWPVVSIGARIAVG